MGRIKATQLLRLEDFPEQKDWIGKLVGPVNDFFRQTIGLVNDGLTFPDNFVGVDRVISFIYTSDAVSLPQAFDWPLKVSPGALQVVSATENGSPFIPLVAWQFTAAGAVSLSRIVRITTAPAVAALSATAKYVLRVRVTP